ncbi:MAG: DMT family transporter [Ahniella sp.]|nr:DMT family transporter [Ahniella sp.]
MIPTSTTQPALRAALLMCVSAVFFALMAVMIRLASSELHAFQIAFFRCFFGFIFTIPLVWHHGPSLLRTDRFGLYLVRCGIGIFSMLSGFWAVVHLPLAQAVALTYSTPLFVTIGAALVLHEVVRARRWTAVLVGFAGVLVIVRPFDIDITFATWVALASAALSAAASISIKFLSRTEKPDTIVFYSTAIWVPLALGPALYVWITPTGWTWAWVVLAGLFGTLGHMFWTRAYKLGDASALTPITYLQLPIVTVFAWILFGEVLDRYTLIGALIVFASNLYIAHRESQVARRAVTDAEIGGDTSSSR